MNDLIDRTIDYLERHNGAATLSGDESAAVDAAVELLRDTIFVGGGFFMEKFAYLIERAIIDGALSGGKLFAGFGGFAQFNHRIDRYREIDTLQNEGFVYGADACEPWSLKHLKPVRVHHNDPLVSTWFLIYRGGDASYSLVARAEPASRPGGGVTAQYKGFWSTRDTIVHYLSDYMEKVVNPQYALEE